MPTLRSNTYDGPERRVGSPCLDHSGHVRWIKANASSIDALWDLKPISLSIFKLVIGVLVTIFLCLFSISLYAALDTRDTLYEISNKQQEIMYSLKGLREDVAYLKNN